MKVYRYIIVCFLFAFIAQLSATYCVDKKALLGWYDISSDDSTDTEDLEEEIPINTDEFHLRISKAIKHQDSDIESVWATPLFQGIEFLISIDHPPEIS